MTLLKIQLQKLDNTKRIQKATLEPLQTPFTFEDELTILGKIVQLLSCQNKSFLNELTQNLTVTYIRSRMNVLQFNIEIQVKFK